MGANRTVRNFRDWLTPDNELQEKNASKIRNWKRILRKFTCYAGLSKYWQKFNSEVEVTTDNINMIFTDVGCFKEIQFNYRKIITNYFSRTDLINSVE